MGCELVGLTKHILRLEKHLKLRWDSKTPEMDEDYRCVAKKLKKLYHRFLAVVNDSNKANMSFTNCPGCYNMITFMHYKHDFERERVAYLNGILISSGINYRVVLVSESERYILPIMDLGTWGVRSKYVKTWRGVFGDVFKKNLPLNYRDSGRLTPHDGRGATPKSPG